MKNLSKVEKILISKVIEDFIGISHSKKSFTKKDYKKLLKLHWKIGLDLIPELFKIDAKSFNTYAKESFERFQKSINTKNNK
jgi:hypothetical protein